MHGVKIMYDDQVAKACIDMGVGFDVSSAGEIQMVKSLGANSDKMIYSNPIKEISHLKIAKENGI